jgi:hypothetical protein
MTGVDGREKRRAERQLKACGGLGPDEEISGAVEAVSFGDTIRELRQVVEEGLNEDRTTLVGSEQTYEVIADFVRGCRTDRTAQVSTKYKTVDRKVRPVTHPCRRAVNFRGKGSSRIRPYEIRPA